MGDMQELRTLIDAPELHTGFLAGLVALLVASLVGAVVRTVGARRTGRDGRRRHPRPGLVGPALVVATLAGISGFGPLDQVGPVPTRVVLALVPAIAGPAVADFDGRSARDGLGPVLLLVSIAGLYTTVPDTELALVLLGAAIPLTLLAWPKAWARLGSGGAYAAVGLYIWVATIEGVGRTGSIVGAVAVLALLVLEPVGRLVAPRVPVDHLPRFLTGARVNAGTLVVGQVLLVAWAARVAGLAHNPIVALVLALPVFALGLAVGAASVLQPGEPKPHRRSRRDRRGGRPPARRHDAPATFEHDDPPPRGDPSMN